MLHRPGVSVFTAQEPTTGFAVDTRHYEQLKDAIDQKQTGWVELDSVYGDGKLLLRVEDIITLVLCTEGYIQAMAEDAVLDG